MKAEQNKRFLHKGFWVAGLFAGTLMLAPAATVWAQGYDGLIPDNRAKPAPRPAPVEHGYEGVVPQARNPDGPSGYQGVMPGHVPERESGIINATPARTAKTPATTPAAQPTTDLDYTPPPEDKRVAAMTPRPGAVPPRPIRTAQDLEDLARRHGFQLNMPKLTDEMAARINVSPKAYSIASSPRMRINGMLPQEAMIKKQIEQVMFSIQMPGITPEQRRRNARAGYEKLKMFADGFMHKANVPDDVYTAMGVPGVFVQEQKESTEKSLGRLREAFKTLKPLQ